MADQTPETQERKIAGLTARVDAMRGRGIPIQEWQDIAFLLEELARERAARQELLDQRREAHLALCEAGIRTHYFIGEPEGGSMGRECGLVERIKLLAAARQETERKAEVKAEFFRGQIRALEDARPLCPDHRDKQRGKPCLACRIEEAERERDEAQRDAEHLWTMLRARRRELSATRGRARKLREALEALGAQPEGYCFCVSREQVEAGHTGECREAQAALSPARPASAQPAPRYDEVYHEGTAWLDAQARPEERPDEDEEVVRIAAAAIRENGTVYTGAHHHQIIRYLAKMHRRPVTGEQGFITSRNRFVCRREAALIAFWAGQIDAECEELFSENLWSVPDWTFVPGSEPAPRPEEAAPTGEATRCPGYTVLLGAADTVPCAVCGKGLAAHTGVLPPTPPQGGERAEEAVTCPLCERAMVYRDEAWRCVNKDHEAISLAGPGGRRNSVAIRRPAPTPEKE